MSGKKIDALKSAIKGLEKLNGLGCDDWTYDSQADCYDLELGNENVRVSITAYAGTSKTTWTVSVRGGEGHAFRTLQSKTCEDESLVESAYSASMEASRFCHDMQVAFQDAMYAYEEGGL